MAMKGYSAFPKALAFLEPHHQIVLYHIKDTRFRGSYHFAELLSVYSTSPADWITGRPYIFLLEALVAIAPSTGSVEYTNCSSAEE